MADEDEIDILGEYNIDSDFTKNDSIYENGMLVSQNSDLLNCDYTIHPQWLLDKPSANPENWYNSGKPQAENEVVEQVSNQNCITDESGWTEKEKNLLETGMAIFGRSSVRLAQFIGSKSASEVKYYLKNFYMENLAIRQSTSSDYVGTIIGDTNLASGDIINDSQIPASIEEVIAAVSTGQPTVHINNLQQTSTSRRMYSEKDSTNLESNYAQQKGNRKLNLIRKSNVKRGRPRKKHKIIKFKVKTKLKDTKRIDSPRVQKTLELASSNVNVEYSKSNVQTDPVHQACDGEIVKIQKDEDSEDIEINIESDNSCDDGIKVKENIESEKINDYVPSSISPSNNKILTEENEVIEPLRDVSSLNDDVVKTLTSLNTPSVEATLNDAIITDLEKAILPDYFDGKSQNKTPQRYLTIRNYILNAWKASKPNYLFKTPLRTGLKNCGDVNCIGRIHYFLEQFGAINFGCEQVKYVRPLSLIIQEPVAKEKTKKNKNEISREIGKLGPRSRIRRKFTNDGEGGCTLAHDDDGHVINKTIVNEDSVVKQRMYIRKPSIRLIYCRPFTKEKPQEYTLKINLSALITMDFHAHTCLSEIMGLVGGNWSPQHKMLTILHYEPCKNIASSATHCDMCPISQAKAADIIHTKGLDILGWFHSHPTFAPEPSQQDLDTQRAVQMWIGHSKPCIGVILSPFSMNGALIASPFRCMIAERHPDIEDRFVPYRFEVEVVSDDFDKGKFLHEIMKIWKESQKDKNEQLVDFNKEYFLDSSITYLDKFVSSVRMNMAKSGSIDKETSGDILKGIAQILSK